MSFNDEILFEKFNCMEPEKASELILSILLTSNPPKRRERAIKKLIEIEDDGHYQEIKSAYLNETHSSVKISFIELLSNIYHIQGIEFLKTQYKTEKDWKVRKQIVKAVQNVSNSHHLDFFVESLKDANQKIKKISIFHLGSTKDPRALEPLIELLKYGNKKYKTVLIDAISGIIKNSGVELLEGYAETGNFHIRRNIPLILKKVGSPSSIDFLKDLAKDSDPLTQINSINTLARILKSAKDTNIDILVQELTTENSNVKHAIIRALGIIGNKQATYPLLKLLKYKNPRTRNLTVKALAKLLKNSTSYKRVQNLIRSRNIIERQAAIKLLGMLNDEDSIDLLLNSLNSQNAKIRRDSYRALLKIIEGDSLEKIVQGLSSKKWQIRKWCAKILFKKMSDNNQDALITHLLSLLEDPKSNVRRKAVNLLSKLNNPAIVERVRDILERTSNWKIRRSCIRLLTKKGGEETLKLLLEFTDDEDFYIRNWVLQAIGRLKDLENIEPIIALLEAEDERIKLSAIESLGKIGDKRALSSLIGQMGETNWEIRKAVENALDKIDPSWMDVL
ncbi:MAG: putative lyase [Promethearchaeota archaeon]|nr:MAG: putative lyase [Candidatus Lokiarchaeota archaeon]